MTEPIARFVGVSLDCADPGALADFYLGLLGGPDRGGGSCSTRQATLLYHQHHAARGMTMLFVAMAGHPAQKLAFRGE